MIKVIHVLTDRNVGGAGRWLLNELACADREKLSLQVVLPPESLLAPRVRALGVTVTELPGMAEASWDRASLASMRRLFEREKPDVVHSHASLTARVAARQAHVGAVVMSKHCAQAPAGLAQRLVNRTVNHFFSDKIIAVSNAVRDEMIAAGTEPGRITTIYNGIVPVPPLSDAEKSALRKSMGMDDTHLWVGTAARLEEVKGVDLFLACAQKVARQDARVRFLICGTGAEEAHLHHLAQPLGERAVFTGFVPNIEQVLSLLDVLVIPSRHEALCLSGIEGLSMGVPAVGFAVDGVPEVIRSEETGLLAPPEDTDALASAVLRLTGDALLRRTLGENGRALVQKEFLATQMAAKIEALYETLLKR